MAPIRVSLFETEPLNAEQRASIGWPGREGIYTSHEILESFHLTARNTIVGGSKYVPYRWRSQLPTAEDPKAFEIIDRAFRQRFPQLADVRFAAHWGGFIGLNLNMLPALGTAGTHNNIHYGIGYGGHGLAQATLMGSVLSDAITGADNEWDRVLRRWNPSWPIEPIRWLTYNGVSKALGAIDRRTDAKILNGREHRERTEA